MPKVFKEDMFALVLATVKRDHYDSDLPIEEQIHSPPDRVQADQWKEIVKYWHEDAKV
ncbi:hypothetical protein RHGRI_034130 [Rhododendron griersonianum]|uniref:Uncharacterized protein n=1 Tax=Rhododendron griersonianum TaxID=479676 RepID=A0AAV6I1Z7_9ERIC|nr:hypothetical protein RHGRI_034130 [Rhododendron griersonianum]